MAIMNERMNFDPDMIQRFVNHLTYTVIINLIS